MTPVVADYRARNLLFLRVPATARVPVTAEVASSSLVVPAIFYFKIQIGLESTSLFVRHKEGKHPVCPRFVLRQ